MNRTEVGIVKRRLEDYASYRTLAKEAEKRAVRASERLLEAGSPHTPALDKIAPIDLHTPMDSIYNSLITEQMLHETEARAWHQKMERIERYISDNYFGIIGDIMRAHYLAGIPYESMENGTTCRVTVHRALEKSEFVEAFDII